MNAEILVALLSFAGTAIGTISGVFINSRLTAYRIEQLEKRVEKLCNLTERVYLIEQRGAVMEENLRQTSHRLGELETRSNA